MFGTPPEVDFSFYLSVACEITQLREKREHTVTGGTGMFQELVQYFFPPHIACDFPPRVSSREHSLVVSFPAVESSQVKFMIVIL